MNKTKIILVATGGVIALAVSVMAYLTWDAFSRRSAALEGDSEGTVEGLEVYAGRVRTLLEKKPFPSAANVAGLERNRQALEAWRTRAKQQAAVGDWCEDDSATPAQFKETILRESRRLIEHPGAAEGGKLMKPDFGFGPFKPYLGDVLPPKDQLARLQRQWYDITLLCDLLVTNGVLNITDLQVVDRKDEAAKAKADPKAKSKAKKQAKGSDEERQPSVMTYTISFLARPEVFTSVVRNLSSCERFTVVERFAFSHEKDALTENLGVAEKKESASSGRRANRRRAVKEDAAKAEKKEGLVYNPAEDSMLAVELTVSVYDFRTLEKSAEEKDGKEASK